MLLKGTVRVSPSPVRLQSRADLAVAEQIVGDPLQARRRTWVRTNQNGPANRAFSLERPTIGPRRVRSQSDKMQTHKPTAHAKTPAHARHFEAAEGIRTLDLLHGKQSVQPRFRTQSRWKQWISEV